MHSLTRIAAAAITIASASVLTGVGAAGAQPGGQPVFDSPSSVVVSGRGENVEVIYKNESGRDLLCTGYVGTRGLIGGVYDHARSAEFNDGTPSELNAALAEAGENGQLGVFGASIDDGESVDLASGDGVTYIEYFLTDSSFAPVALVKCLGDDSTMYIEIEVSAGVGVPAGLGSLDSALTGLGSSGSVAETTGSLGS